jgi:hypothetical protein
VPFTVHGCPLRAPLWHVPETHVGHGSPVTSDENRLPRIVSANAALPVVGSTVPVIGGRISFTRHTWRTPCSGCGGPAKNAQPFPEPGQSASLVQWIQLPLLPRPSPRHRRLSKALPPPLAMGPPSAQVPQGGAALAQPLTVIV